MHFKEKAVYMKMKTTYEVLLTNSASKKNIQHLKNS